MAKDALYAIIPAGGIGKRMQSQKPKQFLTIDGEPILCKTLKTLAETGLFSKFIIPSIDVVYTKKIIKSSLPDLEGVIVIKGGKNRQESIYNGMELLQDDNDLPEFILIHDAVRALVKKETIQAVIERAKLTGAAIAARPVTDTIKLSHMKGNDIVIKKNISRDFMWLAQTPQVFKSDMLMQAYAAAKQDHFIGTDSAGLVERLGIDVHIVESLPSNIKITTPEDLELAILYFRSQK